MFQFSVKLKHDALNTVKRREEEGPPGGRMSTRRRLVNKLIANGSRLSEKPDGSAKCGEDRYITEADLIQLSKDSDQLIFLWPIPDLEGMAKSLKIMMDNNIDPPAKNVDLLCQLIEQGEKELFIFQMHLNIILNKNRVKTLSEIPIRYLTIKTFRSIHYIEVNIKRLTDVLDAAVSTYREYVDLEHAKYFSTVPENLSEIETDQHDQP